MFGDILLGASDRELGLQDVFKNLLGPFWVIFEASYLLFMILILAVFGAAAGAIGQPF